MELCPTEEETAELLSKVLSGNKLASKALAKVVHQDIAFTDPSLDSIEINIPQDILGIWVDPIGKYKKVCLLFTFICSCS
jgi:inositol polyphosphate 1-phosphatase